tara:strand:- start:6161 stop:8212 length:2052 start_codon:yes stop_codon:yes gene_type:complete
MGGVAGHMDHLYDNPNLTFASMKEIMDAAGEAELSIEEKVDGQNLFLSYSIPDRKAKGARNKGNLREGGLDATGLAQKFAGRQALQQAFSGGFSAFETAVEALSDEERKRLFGPNTNIWYNAEVMDPGTPDNPQDTGATNVIKYDDKTLKIHGVGHFEFDRETGEKSPIPEGTLETLDNALERMQQSLHKHDFNLARRAIIQLEKLEDKEAINIAKTRIDRATSAEGLGDNSTVQDYMFSRLMSGMDTDLPPNLKEELTKYILKLPGNIGLKALKKGLSPENLQDLNSIINNIKMLLKEAIYPIEMAVHDFTVEILKGLKSVFISDSEKEVGRLKQELAQAVKDITQSGAEDPDAMEIMQRHLNKIKDFSQITTPVEALVFDYEGHTYKFAGNFAPLNQILGMFRYGKGRKNLATENLIAQGKVITEKEGKKVALLPGGFKPPHAGHYGLAKLLASNSDIDEVIVIIGKKPRESEVEPKITVTAQQSKNIWDLYTKNDENIKVRIQESRTPVEDVYDLIANKNSFSEGDTVVLGKSDKDVGDKRYARAQSWAERHNPGVNVEEMVFPVIGGKSMGGTALRDMIAAGQKESFISKLPGHLSKSDVEAAWNMASLVANETLNGLIDTTLEEISSMSGGSVAGSMGGRFFGAPNTFNVFEKPKKKKSNRPEVKRAKVIRAKRVRRR